MLSKKVLNNMCREYHLIDINTYDKDLYQTELIYRLSYSVNKKYIPKNAIHESTWLYLHNQDECHREWILNIVYALIYNKDTEISGFIIDINLALKKYKEEKYKNNLIQNLIQNTIKIEAENDAEKSFNYIINQYNIDPKTYTIDEYFNFYYYYYYNDDNRNEVYLLYDAFYTLKMYLLLDNLI
jgi:hypothetical protein